MLSEFIEEFGDMELTRARGQLQSNCFQTEEAVDAAHFSSSIEEGVKNLRVECGDNNIGISFRSCTAFGYFRSIYCSTRYETIEIKLLYPLTLHIKYCACYFFSASSGQTGTQSRDDGIFCSNLQPIE